MSEEWKTVPIRKRYSQGGTSIAKLAKEYGVSQGVVYKAVNRETWKHV